MTPPRAVSAHTHTRMIRSRAAEGAYIHTGGQLVRSVSFEFVHTEMGKGGGVEDISITEMMMISPFLEQI